MKQAQSKKRKVDGKRKELQGWLLQFNEQYKNGLKELAGK